MTIKQIPASQELIRKWEKASQPKEVIEQFPNFARFLEESLLLSQMKITRDRVTILDGEPALLVEGKLLKESEFKKRFEVAYSKLYDQKLLVEKATRDIFTYLDNGRGLERHHPYQTTRSPISTLSDEDYQTTWEKAAQFVRSEEKELSEEERHKLNQNRPFILQVVTSYTHRGDSNFTEFLCNPRHAYVRLIVGVDNPELGTRKGEVYGGGFGWKKSPILPFMAIKGGFRSPDVWEYLPATERLVTNICLSQEEARRLHDFTMRYHLDGIHLGNETGFHLSRQNCTVYVREACRAAGITIPTEIGLGKIISKIVPVWMQTVNNSISSAATSLSNRLSATYIGSGLIKIHRVVSDAFSYLFVFLSTPFRAGAGLGLGEGGAAFTQGEEEPKKMAPSLWRSFFTPPKFNLPGVLQEWQRAQPSTAVYQKPVRLTVIPS